jgi:glucokinase
LAVIGIDLGATKTAGLLFEGERIEQKHRLPTDASSPQGIEAGLMEICSRLIEEAAGKGLEVEALGLGIAGFIDFPRGVVTDAPNHPLHNYPVRDILQERFQVPVFVDNDGNLSALAESRMGAGKGANHLVHLTMGTGIGGGIILDGRVYRGALGAAAELGHMIIMENGPLCNCGARGCLESLVSGVAIYRRVERLAMAGEKSPLTDEFLADPACFAADDVCRHANDGNKPARDILAEAGSHLGVGIASLVNIFNPEVVTLSGGLLGCFKYMENTMRQSFGESAIPISRDHVRILTGTLGNEGGSLGAALLAISRGNC